MMDLLEAHARFGLMDDRSILPITVTVYGGDIWPAFAAGLAALSGMLDDAKSNDDLLAAVEHAKTLLSCEVLTFQQVQQETQRVLATLIAWGDHYAAQQN